MNRDDLFIDFLPEEYRPKPEWRSFPLVAAAVLLTIGLGIFLNYQQLENRKSVLTQDIESRKTELAIKEKRAAEFLPLQGKTRVLNLYMRQVLALRAANPPWWDVYNRLEEILPEGTWIQNFRFTGARRGWPGVSITVVAAGTSYSPLYNMYVNLLNAPEFTAVRTTGYTLNQMQGQYVLTSNFTFSLDRWQFIQAPQVQAPDAAGAPAAEPAPAQ